MFKLIYLLVLIYYFIILKDDCMQYFVILHYDLFCVLLWSNRM